MSIRSRLAVLRSRLDSDAGFLDADDITSVMIVLVVGVVAVLADFITMMVSARSDQVAPGLQHRINAACADAGFTVDRDEAASIWSGIPGPIQTVHKGHILNVDVHTIDDKYVFVPSDSSRVLCQVKA